MNTAIAVYDPMPVCECCGKLYTGLNDYEFVGLFAGDADQPICDSCIENGGAPCVSNRLS